MGNNQNGRSNQCDHSHWRGGYRGRGDMMCGRTFRPYAGESAEGNNATTLNAHSNERSVKIHSTDESKLVDAAVSPSPLTDAQFRYQLGYSGRGYTFRGRGFRGRGWGGPGRAEVAAMIASKSWSRSKANVAEEQS